MATDESDGGTPDADVPTLLGDDHEAFEAALSGDSEGPVAVVGDPFAGRETVLDRAADALDATRIALAPSDGIDRVRAAIDDGPLVVEDCQHLYERRIGGFTGLSAFLDAVATAGDTVVTGWNRFAWAYLSAVRGVDQAFPTVAEIGPVPEERLAELVLARYDEMPTFVADDTDRRDSVSPSRYEIEWRGRSASITVPGLRLAPFRDLSSRGDLDPADVTFGRLAAVSDGNVGVATAIWEAGRAAEVRPSDVAVPTSDRDLDREEAFCLRIVLAKERVERRQLARIVDGVDRILGRLSRDGLVTVEDGVVSLVPAAVPTATDATERRRIL